MSFRNSLSICASHAAKGMKVGLIPDLKHSPAVIALHNAIHVFGEKGIEAEGNKPKVSFIDTCKGVVMVALAGTPNPFSFASREDSKQAEYERHGGRGIE